MMDGQVEALLEGVDDCQFAGPGTGEIAPREFAEYSGLATDHGPSVHNES
jgi:hypothetical protein